MTAPASTVREYKVDARATETFGRVLCSARDHHFIVDGPEQNGCPGEEVTPVELFLAAVGSCGVELVSVIARDDKVPLRGVRVHAWGKIDRAEQKRPDVTLFTKVHFHFTLEGTDGASAARLIEAFKRR